MSFRNPALQQMRKLREQVTKLALELLSSFTPFRMTRALCLKKINDH